MTKTTASIQELLDSYTRSTVLPVSVQEQLVAAHDDTIDLIATGQVSSINQLHLAPSELCGEADLPRGSTYAEVVAALLDIHHGTSGHLHDLVRSATAGGIELAAGSQVW